jgi:hypothetical protein
VSDSLVRSAAFVRSFFDFLENRNISAALLHGGDDGFERKLSDVDFVVCQHAFPLLPTLIDAYCNKVGWRLCQVLRHETTAAFCVCSANDDANCAVALDGCSDYQRNGTLFLTAESLLENRKPLTWGGYCLAPATELRYRFAKAAAKGKDITACMNEFATYPADVLCACATWLVEQWGISPESWDAAGLGVALTKLRQKSNRRPSLSQTGALERITSRIIHPTGLIVITGHEDYEVNAIHLQQIFGHLYFRRTRMAAQWQPLMYKDLISTTLIILPEIGYFWSKLIPADCIHRLDPTQSPNDQCKKIAIHLHERCLKRENLQEYEPK